MRNFWRRSGITPLSENVLVALKNQRGLSDSEAAPLRMLTEAGWIERATVTFFRVFDPTPIRWAGMRLRGYDDVPMRSVIHAGYITTDGTIILTPNPIPSGI